MNYIVSVYISGIEDSQRKTVKLPDDSSYIQTWYDSLVRCGLKGIVFHNELSGQFISKYLECKFIRVQNRGYTLYEFKYFMLKELRNIDFDNIFYTDIADVIIIKNPFIQSEYLPDNIYCGDEERTVRSWPMLHVDKCFRKLTSWNKVINSRNKLLNAGIVGGGRDVMLSYVDHCCKVIDKCRNRKENTYVDIPVYNYVLYRYFNPVHGEPVNSIFGNYEKRGDVWFIHK